MLSIGKLLPGKEGYYLEKVAEGAEEYYSGEGEAEGYWIGEGAELLGLGGKVEPEQLIAMLSGNDPASGDPLGLKSGPGGESVPGFDLTFSAPKSVSLTWALGGSPVGAQVAEAHTAAVREALAYMQQNACWARRGRGGREFIPGAGYLAVAYPHRSSRAGDPQIHTHVLIANATFAADGRWSRLYHLAIYEHAKTAGYIYEAHLREELTQRLGVQWGPVRNGIADIKGFTPEQLAHFSTRREEILEAAGGEGASARAMQIATLATRSAKDRELTDATLRETWRVKALEVGLDREVISRFLGRGRPGQTILSAGLLERAVTAHASHFDRRDAIQAVAANLPHGAPAAEVERLADAFLASEGVIEIADAPRGASFTTRRIWELERRALQSAEEMAAPAGAGEGAEIVIGRVLGARPSLKPDQRQMVARLIGGGEQLAVVIGEAGTGKSYALAAAVSGWAQSGTAVQAAAPTWRAVNVLRAEGIEATTVAGLLTRLAAARQGDGQGLARGSVLLVDEAGMVDSASLARLIEHARRAGARLVLIGDPEQLGEIEAGGLFGALAARSEPILLSEVIRHRYELDRDGARMIREGRGGQALEVYRAQERVTVAEDRELLRREMVRDFNEARQRGEDAMMIAKRNDDVGELNAHAREVLKAQGQLRGEEIEIAGRRFAVGDRVITRVNDQSARIYNRERWEVVGVDARAQSVRLAGIDTDGRQVGVDAGYLRKVNPRDGAPALEHAYAATIYQAQGATLDRAFVMADGSMSRQEFYVAASRSRGETRFYATPDADPAREEIAPASGCEGLQHIAEAAERDGAQLAAHDKALRGRLEPLPTGELEARRRELASQVGAERTGEQGRERLVSQIEAASSRLDRIAEQSGRAGELPRRQRGPELARLQREAAGESRAIARLEAKLAELPPSAHQARAEVAALDRVLSQRQRAEAVALRIAPPEHVVKALGGRPTDRAKARTWDQAAQRIEGYRREFGVKDKGSALGGRPDQQAQRRRWENERNKLAQARRRLELERSRARAVRQSLEVAE